MSSHVSLIAGASPHSVKSEYAQFCQWVREFFARHPDPDGVLAIRVFNAAFRSGFTRASKYLFQAANDGTIKKVRFDRFALGK